MTDAELLFQWVSGQRRLTLTEQADLRAKGYCRLRSEASCHILTPKGSQELSKPRRLFRPMGSKPTAVELLTAALGGVVAITGNPELANNLTGLVTQKSTIETLEITSAGRTLMLKEIPAKEIRGIYGSEFIR